MEKMEWALTLLQDPETLRTFEDFAMEAAYETEDTQPPASNPQTRRAQAHPTPPLRHRRTKPLSEEGTSTGNTGMDVDQDLPEGTTPLGTPFDDDHTTHQHGGAPSMDPPAGIYTRNFFTPLYTESQEIDHTTANTGQHTPQTSNGHLDPIHEAEMDELAAAAAPEAEAHRTVELEAKAVALAAEAEALAAAAADEAEACRTSELEAKAADIAAEAHA
jgi:hypothetical protein